MNELLVALRAVAESTRLRLFALCAQGQLTVSELAQILGQSQPRVSRHLRLLTEAGLLERVREGSWVFHRLEQDGRGGAVARHLAALLPVEDAQLALDRSRLDEIKRDRQDRARAYFRQNAEGWDRLRSMHVDEAEVERAILGTLPADGIAAILDVGTGTGRMLELFGPHVERAHGIDLSREMLAVARANLERSNLKNCHVRQADMYQLPFGDDSFDAITVHQVLHFADDPRRAIAEAARVLGPGGRILVVDFAPHGEESLRIEHQHRRLGFADGELDTWYRAAGLATRSVEHLPGGPLTVGLWLGTKPGPAP